MMMMMMMMVVMMMMIMMMMMMIIIIIIIIIIINLKTYKALRNLENGVICLMVIGRAFHRLETV